MNTGGKRKEAIQLGLTKYFTGKPCKHGHIAERYVDSGVCQECLLRRMTIYINTHREECVERTKQWRKNNPDYCNDYYATNSERSKELTRIWKRKNPDKVALLVDRRKWILKQATPKWFERDLVQLVYQKRDQLSELWGVDFTVDHIVPLQGDNVCGLHCWANLQLLIREENGRKWKSN